MKSKIYFSVFFSFIFGVCVGAFSFAAIGAKIDNLSGSAIAAVLALSSFSLIANIYEIQKIMARRTK